MTFNKLQDDIRQQIQATTEPTASTKDQWTLDADKEDIRHALGAAFAGTDKVLGEPTWVWGMSHFKDLSIEDRVHWTRYLMSFSFFGDLREKNYFQLCSKTSDGEISSFTNVQEYDTEVKAGKWFPKLRHGWNFLVDNLRLVFVHKEEFPSLFHAKDLKQDSKRFQKKLGDFEEKCDKWHREVMPKGSHWYVHAVGVNPAFQGQGKGKALMNKLNDLADKAKQTMYLEAGDRNRKFYEKMGFKVVRSEQLVDPEDPNDIFLVHLFTREPAKAL